MKTLWLFPDRVGYKHFRHCVPINWNSFYFLKFYNCAWIFFISLPLFFLSLCVKFYILNSKSERDRIFIWKKFIFITNMNITYIKFNSSKKSGNQSKQGRFFKLLFLLFLFAIIIIFHWIIITFPHFFLKLFFILFSLF